MLTAESTSTIISTTHDGNPRLTFQQNRDGSSYRLYRIQQGKQTYPDHHRPTNGLARSDTDPKQVCRHNHQGIHQTLLTQTHAPGSYYQTMAQSSRTRSSTKSRGILASRGYSLHYTTLKAMES